MEYELILLGFVFILFSQFGKIISEYFFLKYEHNLVLRRLMILSIFSQIGIVSTDNYYILIASISCLGLSVGGDLNILSYYQDEKMNSLFFGLS